MIKEFVTGSGSRYVIDFDKKTWLRERGPEAAEIRTDVGEFTSFEYTDFGGFLMICPPFDPTGDPDNFRVIISTTIASEREINATIS